MERRVMEDSYVGSRDSWLCDRFSTDTCDRKPRSPGRLWDRQRAGGRRQAGGRGSRGRREIGGAGAGGKQLHLQLVVGQVECLEHDQSPDARPHLLQQVVVGLLVGGN